MINSREIKDLSPEMQVLCKAFIAECKRQGIDIIITSTYRDFESQDALYAQGRTKPGNKVTNAAAGMSFHNHRAAFDFAPLKSGKIDWDDLKLFTKCGQIAESVGLTWGGNFSGKFKDLPHCQIKGVTIEELNKNARKT